MYVGVGWQCTSCTILYINSLISYNVELFYKHLIREKLRLACVRYEDIIQSDKTPDKNKTTIKYDKTLIVPCYMYVNETDY